MRHEAIRLEGSRYSLAAVAAITSALIFLFWPRVFPLDDAYITLTNARVLMSGAPDPAYGTSYLTGATSPIHLLLVAVLGTVVPPIWASLLIGIVGAVLALLALIRLGERAGLETWQARLVALAGGLSGYSLYHDFNGLETSLGMAASGWLLVWCNDQRKLPRLAGIAPFIRPELALLASLLLARQFARTRDPRPLAVAVAIAAPFATWMMIETGQPLPSTIGAKLAFYREYTYPLIDKIRVSVSSYANSLLLPLLLGLLGLPKVAGGRVGALFVVVGMLVAFWIAPGSFNWNDGRYLAIFTPVLVAGIAALIAERSRASRLLLVLLCGWAIVSCYMSILNYAREVTYARHVEAHAKFVATLPASSVVLIHDAGWVAWERPKAKLVDVVGLKTPAAVLYHKRMTVGYCKWGPALNAMARDYHATHVVILNRWNWDECIGDGLRTHGWKLSPIYSDLYSVYRLSE